MKRVYVGDVGVDEYTGQLLPGGCALNTAFHGKKLGLSVDLVSCLGNDEAAKIPLTICQKINLSADHISILPGQTPKQKIQILPNGEKNFISYLPGVLRDFSLEKHDIDFIKEHDALITVYFDQIKNLFNQLIKINFPGLKIIDFMNGSDFQHNLSFVIDSSHWWDVGFFGLSDKDEKFIVDLIKLSQKSQKLILVTLGSKGSLVSIKGKIYWQKAKFVKNIIDTSGCGDAYLASFLSGILNGNDILAAMKKASTYSSKIAGHLGSIKLK